jgi:hypothetical protein
MNHGDETPQNDWAHTSHTDMLLRRSECNSNPDVAALFWRERQTHRTLVLLTCLQSRQTKDVVTA